MVAGKRLAAVPAQRRQGEVAAARDLAEALAGAGDGSRAVQQAASRQGTHQPAPHRHGVAPAGGRVVDLEAGLLPALPGVEPDTAGEPQRHARFQELAAEGGGGAAKGDGLDPAVGGAGEHAADMAVADDPGLDHPRVGEPEAGLGVAGTVGRELLRSAAPGWPARRRR